jgi:GWxTD domain-containing protein
MNHTKTYRISRAILSIFILTILLASCKTSQTAVDSKDLSYLYNPTKNPINPQYNITNQSDDESILSVKFFSTDLFFSEANPQGIPTALIQLYVKLFNTTQGKVLADTAFYNFSIVKDKEKLEYVYRIPLSVKKGTEYVAEVKILDRLRLKVVQAFITFNTLSDSNRYNFTARGHFEKNELFNHVLRVNEFINILYSRKTVDSLFISFYRLYKKIPDPPSMILPEQGIDYGPDATIPLQYSDTLPVMFPKEGIYLCRIGRKIREGYTFFNFGSAFPSMTTPEVMAEPLAYLATPDEINSILSSSKPKAALDDFWIKCGGNIEKARELIRIYYTRVLYSNYYFTSYKEGWRSDRGMIYIIYGPPDKVYKNSEGENWGYMKPVIKTTWGGRVHMKEEFLYFNFKKKENIFSDNDYNLSRSETPVTFWDQAVLSWRKGIVFRLDNPVDI